MEIPQEQLRELHVGPPLTQKRPDSQARKMPDLLKFNGNISKKDQSFFHLENTYQRRAGVASQTEISPQAKTINQDNQHRAGFSEIDQLDQRLDHCRVSQNLFNNR